ncbi:hypothetical protein N802_10665 [Knoellia sinensis KCTC 19936]|uniref:Uncharacterized protein n=1 Tax=Knoellia sinensis KCTC 19936 TaxID=1385520 RepID=A0A0A0J983_9MICO|nr:hypothetical protein [Knoellia sinensis]KGN32171.1 hypothetical protein N802_10665 [Knoellia sinensis KCTC 19936]
MDVDVGFFINWGVVPLFLIPALAIAFYAKHVSGGWLLPWINLKPVWWFVLLFVLPWIGYLVLVVNLLVHRNTPGAITGRRASASRS